MSPSWRRSILTGIIATLLFSLFLHLAALVNGPRFNIPLWDGTLVTLNLAAATIVGYGLEFLVGIFLTALYRGLSSYLKGSAIARGLTYGAMLWIGLMVVGMPLFGAVSPLVRDGLILSPGFFALHLGISAAVVWLLALELFGTSVAVLMDQNAIHLPSL